MIYANRGKVTSEGHPTDLLSDLCIILDYLMDKGINKYELEASVEIAMEGHPSGEDVVNKAIGKEVGMIRMELDLMRAMEDDLK